MFRIPDFMRNAKNVYRTKHYIIKQDISIKCDDSINTELHSDDTYYARNRKLDKVYEEIFFGRKHINGQRIHTTTHTKKYIF